MSQKISLNNGYLISVIVLCSYLRFLNFFLNNVFLIVLPGTLSDLQIYQPNNSSSECYHSSTLNSTSLYIQSASIISTKQIVRFVIIFINLIWIDKVPVWVPLLILLGSMTSSQLILIFFNNFYILYIARSLEAIYSSLSIACISKMTYSINLKTIQMKDAVMYIGLYFSAIGNVVSPVTGAYVFYRYGRQGVFVVNASLVMFGILLAAIWFILTFIYNRDQSHSKEEKKLVIDVVEPIAKLKCEKCANFITKYSFVLLSFMALLNFLGGNEGLITMMTIWIKSKFHIQEKEISQNWELTGFFTLPVIFLIILVIYYWPRTRFTILIVGSFINNIFWILIPSFPTWKMLWLPQFLIIVTSAAILIIDQVNYFNMAKIFFGTQWFGRFGLIYVLMQSSSYFICANVFGFISDRLGFIMLCYFFGGLGMIFSCCFISYKYYFDLAEELKK